MRKTFAEEKFHDNFKIAVLSMLTTYLTMLADTIMVGQVIGETALAAFTLMTPYITLIEFMACIIASGTAVMIALEVGKGSRENGNRYFQLGILLTIAAGILLSILFFLSRNFMLGNRGVAPETEIFIHHYFWTICLLPIWQIGNELLYSVIWNAGGTKYCITSLLTQLISNIVFSMTLMQFMGISGTGLGTIISFILANLAFVPYFFSKECVLKPGLYFNLKAAWKVICFSLRDSLMFLYLTIMQLVLNTFLLRRFGAGGVLVLSIIMNLEGMYLTVFDAPAEAVSVLLHIFAGEKNRRGIIKAMQPARKTAVIEGFIAFLLLMIFAGFIPGLFGIKSQLFVHRATVAIRIFSVLALIYPSCMLYSTYFLAIEELGISLGALTMQVLVMPLLFGITMSYAFGLNGVWLGFVFGSLFSLLNGMLYVWRKHKKNNQVFPYLLNKNSIEHQLSYDVKISTENVMKLVNQVEMDLKRFKVNQDIIYRVMLMIEETEMLVVEKNKGKEGIIQCDIFVEDKIRLILRDSGPYSDATDRDAQIYSFRAYTSAMIVGNSQDNTFVLTCGHNRTIFEF